MLGCFDLVCFVDDFFYVYVVKIIFFVCVLFVEIIVCDVYDIIV